MKLSVDNVNINTQLQTCDIPSPNLQWDHGHVITLPGASSYTFSTQYWRKLDDNAGVSCRYAIDLPGCNPDDINVSLSGSYLQVTATRSDTKTPFFQQIAVDDCWDLKSAEADYEYAVVTVRFSRKPAVPATKITLNVKT